MHKKVLLHKCNAFLLLFFMLCMWAEISQSNNVHSCVPGCTLTPLSVMT